MAFIHIPPQLTAEEKLLQQKYQKLKKKVRSAPKLFKYILFKFVLILF